MRTVRFPTLITVTAVFALLLTPDMDRGQPPPDLKPQKVKAPPDEFRSLVKEVEEAYKAPFEVDKDILDELRKQYKNPTPDREAKIFREIRRLYNLTPAQEEEIVRELRRAYERQSPDQEARVFDAIRRNGKLPPGAIAPERMADRAAKLFRDFDRDGDGRLSRDEAPDALRDMWGRFDRNGDGFIEFAEYGAYYQAHLRVVSDRVAAGEIEIKLPRGAVLPSPEPPLPGLAPSAPQPPREPRKNEEPFAIRYGKLPPGLPGWFETFDTDHDGQISLYEWRQQGAPAEAFADADRDGDFLITPQELLRFLADRARVRPAQGEWVEP